MKVPDPVKLKEILHDALALPEADRPAFIAAATAGEAALRDEVEAMLAALSAATARGFMSQTTADVSPARPQGWAAAAICEGPGSSIGNYKLLQLIGEGGFGSVFMAEQRRPVNRKVALKIIKLGMDTRQVIARFEAERQALAIMDHPNIARVLDGGATDGGRPYFVMELVKGDPITQYCDENHLSINERLDLFVQVCHAVQHAHQKGIIHRDLKPNNILVSTQDGRPFAKVIDFGIAKATASRLTEKTLFTEHRALIGTPEYMSPEQAGGSLDIDTRTDIYSLGVLLYELLTGSTPFSGKDLRRAAYEEIERLIRETDPPKPSTRISTSVDTIGKVAALRRTEPRKLGSLVRGELDWIVMKALEKDRARRYETASNLAEDIANYGSGREVIAAPPSATYRLRKFARRYRKAIVTATAVGIVLVAGVIASSIEASRARRAEHQVDSQLSVVQHAKSVAEDKTTEAQRRLKEANEANKRAEDALRVVKRQTSDRFVDLGLKEWEQKEFAYAALWFTQALKLDQGDPERERMQRYRIGGSFACCAHPIFSEKDRIAASTQPAPREIWSNEKEFGVRNSITKAPISPAMPRGSMTDFELGSTGEILISYYLSYSSDKKDSDRKDIVRIWDANRGVALSDEIPFVPSGGDETPIRYFPLNISDDRSLMACVTSAGARIFDLTSGRQISNLVDRHMKYCRFSLDGTKIVTVSKESADGSTEYARLWESRSGRRISGELQSPTGADLSVRFSKNALALIIRYENGTTQLYDPNTAKLNATIDDSLLSFSNKHYEFDNLFAFFDDNTVDLYDMASGKQTLPQITASGTISDASFDNHGTAIAILLEDGQAQIIDAKTGSISAPVRLLKHIFPGEHPDIYVSSDKTMFLTTLDCLDGIRIWDSKTGEMLSAPIRAEAGGLGFSDDSTELVERNGWNNKWHFGQKRHWELWTRGLWKNLEETSGDKRFTFCNNGSRLFVINGRCARLLDATTLVPVAPPLLATSGDVERVAVSKDGT